MTENNNILSIEELRESGLLGEPSHFGKYLGRYIEKKGSNPSREAKKIGVQPSTMKRLIDGAMLSENMAAKLHKEYGFDIELMFRLDAKYLAAKAHKIAAEKSV